MSKLPVVGVFVTLALIGLALAEEDKTPPRALHEQSQNGVTVRLESVTIERVYNEAAFWEKEIGADWKKNRIAGARPPKWIVYVFVSVVDCGNNSGPVMVEFTNYKTNVSGESHFSPPSWQKQFRTIEVDPKARGHMNRYLIYESTKLTDLFPATVTVHTTNKSGDKLEFVFKNVEF